jgi:acetyl/propionyl-CoA carboxylase alpha subunit
VEFLVDPDGGYYLLEMNTRLQVEHPVTEAVVGLDIVAWQLRIAAGEPLSFEQDDVDSRGHAIEARVYAEDPARDFMPSVGRLAHYVAPQGPGIRCDDGVRVGDTIGGHYDAMVAKVIAYGSDRTSAVARLGGALREMVVLGVVTNLPLLQSILEDPQFLAGATHTRFLEDRFAGWQAPGLDADSDWIAAAVAEALGNLAPTAEGGAAVGDGVATHDPWAVADGWRNARP